jgi:hypothetical protein
MRRALMILVRFLRSVWDTTISRLLKGNIVLPVIGSSLFRVPLESHDDPPCLPLYQKELIVVNGENDYKEEGEVKETWKLHGESGRVRFLRLSSSLRREPGWISIS